VNQKNILFIPKEQFNKKTACPGYFWILAHPQRSWGGPVVPLGTGRPSKLFEASWYHARHVIPYIYCKTYGKLSLFIFLHYINIWDQKVKNFVFCEAFLPITWMKPSAGVMNFITYDTVNVWSHMSAWHHDASNSSDGSPVLLGTEDDPGVDMIESECGFQF